MRFIKLLFSLLFIISFAFTLYINISDETDYSAPEIKCDADTITATVDTDDNELLKHVSAIDEKDGDISDQVIIESISPFIGKNNAKIIFAVCDSDNNVTKLEKDIIYSDYVNPTFSLSKLPVFYVGSTRLDLLAGVSASDMLDGDISSRIVVADSQIDLSQPGIYPVKYSVTTQKGITSEIDINVYVYASKLKENIELKTYLTYTELNKKIDPQSFIVSYPEEYLEENYRDYYDYSFDIIDEVDYKTPGIYYITYRLSRFDERDDEAEPEILAESFLAVAVRGEN